MSFSAPFAAMWFWFIGLSALFVGPPVLIVGTSVWMSTRRARRAEAADGSRDGLARQAMRHARIGRLGGLGVGALAGAVVFLAGPAIIAAAALALAAPILFAVVSPPVDTRSGWMIAVSLPLALIAVLALAGLALLMARVAALPQPVSQNQSGLGRSRANTARAIAGAVLGIELLALGGLAIVGSTDVVGPLDHAGAGYLASRILVWSGLGLAFAGMLTWAVLGRWRSNSVAPPEPGDQGRTAPRIA